MSSKLSRPLKADYGLLLLATLATVGGFLMLGVGKITFEQFLLTVSPPWTFFFGRVNGRANGPREGE